jgi:hypothetical protein
VDAQQRLRQIEVAFGLIDCALVAVSFERRQSFAIGLDASFEFILVV